MHALTALVSLSAVASAAVLPRADSQSFKLKTQLKSTSADKTEFANQYLVASHYAAGFNVAAFLPNETSGIVGTLNNTNLGFNLGGGPYQTVMPEETNLYFGWQPIEINAGSGGTTGQTTGFFFNDTGLQWSSANELSGYDTFQGWLICDWSNAYPQLFVRNAPNASPFATPSNCADVNLIPEYVS